MVIAKIILIIFLENLDYIKSMREILYIILIYD
jgi:hypothetical protein